MAVENYGIHIVVDTLDARKQLTYLNKRIKEVRQVAYDPVTLDTRSYENQIKGIEERIATMRLAANEPLKLSAEVIKGNNTFLNRFKAGISFIFDGTKRLKQVTEEANNALIAEEEKQKKRAEARQAARAKAVLENSAKILAAHKKENDAVENIEKKSKSKKVAVEDVKPTEPKKIEKAIAPVEDFVDESTIEEDLNNINLTEATKSFIDELNKIGMNVSAGLSNGIKDNAEAPVDATKSVTEAVIDAAKDTLDEHSPSKVFHKIGAYIVEGLREGIDDEANAKAILGDSVFKQLKDAGAELSAKGLLGDKDAAKLAIGEEPEKVSQQNVVKALKEYNKKQDALKRASSRLEKGTNRVADIHKAIEEATKATNEIQKIYDAQMASLSEERGKYGNYKVTTTKDISGINAGVLSTVREAALGHKNAMKAYKSEYDVWKNTSAEERGAEPVKPNAPLIDEAYEKITRELTSRYNTALKSLLIKYGDISKLEAEEKSIDLDFLRRTADVAKAEERAAESAYNSIKSKAEARAIWEEQNADTQNPNVKALEKYYQQRTTGASSKTAYKEFTLEKLKKELESIDITSDGAAEKVMKLNQEIEKLQSQNDNAQPESKVTKSKGFGGFNFTAFSRNAVRNVNIMSNAFKRVISNLMGMRTIASFFSNAVRQATSNSKELGAATTAAFQMIGAMLAPLTKGIATFFMKLIKYINIFIKALTGVDLLANSVAQSTSSAAGSAKSMAKSLAPFDTISNIGGSGGGGGGGLGADWTGAMADVKLNPKLVEYLQKLGERLKPLYEYWKKLIDEWKKTDWADNIVEILGKIFKFLGGILGVIGLLKMATGNIAGGLGTIAAGIGLGALGKDMEKYAKEMKEGAEGTSEMSEAGKKLSSTFGKLQTALGGILIVAAAILGASGNYAGAAAAVAGGVALLKDGVESLGESIGVTAEDYKNFDFQIVSSDWGDTTGMVDLLSNAINGNSEEMEDAIDKAGRMQAVYEGLAGGANGAKDSIDGAKTSTESFATSLEDKMKELDEGKLDQPVTDMFTKIKDAAEKTKSTVTTAMTGVKGAIEGTNIVIKPTMSTEKIAKSFRLKWRNSDTGDTGSNSFTINAFARGSNYIPNDQLALLHRGEAVVPKKFNKREFFAEMGGYSNDEIVDELRAIKAEIGMIDVQPVIGIKEIGEATEQYRSYQSRILGKAV
jgi:hypothetical protein